MIDIKVSIIVPVYNTEKYLKKCLNSLVKQTLDEIEIIIINDGSVDKSQEIIDEFSNQYPDKIKSYIQSNSGQAAARNFGLKKAVGEYVLFIDSDDYIEVNTCEKVYGMAKQSDLDILCFNMREEFENNLEKPCNYYNFNDFPKNIKYVLNETSVWNKMIRREFLIKNGLFFMEDYIYEDLELIPRLVLYTNKIDFIDDKLYHYVIHNDSTMRQKTYNPKLNSIFVVIESLKKKFDNTPYTNEMEYLCIEHLLHGAVLRYLDYPEGNKDIIKIADIMKKDFPNWRKNKYYRKQNLKYKIVCELAFNKKIKLLKKILRK